MPMIEEMEATGFWLFKKRSYLPFATILLLLAGLAHMKEPLGGQRIDQAWDLFCCGVAFLGLIVRVVTAGFAPKRTSGRCTTKLVASTLNTTGMYSIVRNPLYLGNFLGSLGPALLLRVWWVPMIFALLFLIYYERIVFAEEAFLRREFGELYTAWASATPAFFPRFRQWRPPALKFNWRKVCRKENQTLFGIVVVFYIIKTAGDWVQGNPPFENTMWNVILAAGLIPFAIARLINKFTGILKDPDRNIESQADSA